MKYGTSPAARRLRRGKHDLLAIRRLDGLLMFVRTRRGTAVFDNAANVVAIVSIADGGLDDGRRRNAKSEDTLDTLSAQ
jgi:hypothetical protein